jgi:hypothetical protein
MENWQLWWKLFLGKMISLIFVGENSVLQFLLHAGCYQIIEVTI